MSLERIFPPLLRELHKLDFDYRDGEGIEFEPYDEFMSLEETRSWLGAWTGNPEVSADEYLIFGQDGSGGYAAIWVARTHEPLLKQPIVFFGSEGELGVVAPHFSDYLWVLASDHGPLEAVSTRDVNKPSNEVFTAFAKRNATTPQRNIDEIFAAAAAEFPNFVSHIHSLCR